MAQLDMFMYIKAYSEPMAYSDIYLGITHEQFMLILNLRQIQAYLALWLV